MYNSRKRGHFMLQNMYPGSLYASVADKEGYKQIKNIFIETADNEKEHAKRFYKFLLEGFQLAEWTKRSEYS